MAININYKETLFKRDNLTPIRGELTFETFHKLWNEIKSNAKAIYSNIGGVAHGHLGLVLTNVQYALIYPTPFVYPNHPDNFNMQITHTKEVCLFLEVTGMEQYICQKIVGTVEVDYLADIRSRTKNSINDTVTGVLMHLQENYGQFMTHELLEREDIAKKKITTRATRSRPCSPQSRKSSSLPTQPGHLIPSPRRSIFPLSYFTVRARSG